MNNSVETRALRAIVPVLQSLYQPLDDNSDEIRLVTIEPLQPDGITRCHLSTASLRAYRPEYLSFIHTPEFSGQTARRLLSEWIRFREQKPEVESEKAALSVGLGPSQGFHRYLWGDFATLSYVWGEEKCPGRIFLNGTIVPVTKNLEIALRELAVNKEFQHDGYRIWIDAICINQKDEIERVNQVRKMRERYSKAWNVISWLGRNDGPIKAKQAFHFLRTLASLPGDKQDLGKLLISEPGLVELEGLFVLHEFMKLPYWKRLWVVQEIVMGSSFTILRCGDAALDLDTFCRGIAVLYRGLNWTLKDRVMASESRRMGLGNIIYGWNNVISLHLVHQAIRELIIYESKGSGNRLGFRRLLQIACSTKCRDVRDKVFALLGLMDPQVAGEITQDYSLDTPELFAAVARAFIKHYDNLEPLRLANPWGRADLPTWAADWTWGGRMPSWRPGSTFTGSIGKKDASNILPKPETVYNAHAGSPAAYGFPGDWRYLQCAGFVLDVVGGLGAPECDWFSWDRTRAIPYPSWTSAYGNHEETAQALFGALLGIPITNDENSPLQKLALSSLPSKFLLGFPQFSDRGWTWLADQERYYYKWEHWREAHNDFMLGQQPLRGFFTDAIPEDAEESVYVDAYCNVREMVMERRFMLTRCGHLGWAPDNFLDKGVENHTKIGDLVVILFGCSTPLIIRPREDKFIIVGEAYVQGFMDGEALRLIEDGICEVQTFLLC